MKNEFACFGYRYYIIFMARIDKTAIVKYWFDTAERDYQTMEHLFESGDYHWGLFIGHLVLEKLLKALYVQEVDENTPHIHDLSRLAQKCELRLDDDMLDKLEFISRFNLSVRYPDYHQEFYNLCTKEFAYKSLDSIKEIRTWLLSLIQIS